VDVLLRRGDVRPDEEEEEEEEGEREGIVRPGVVS
jgi:hypothetical protein